LLWMIIRIGTRNEAKRKKHSMELLRISRLSTVVPHSMMVKQLGYMDGFPP